jgi:hypothetical protein
MTSWRRVALVVLVVATAGFAVAAAWADDDDRRGHHGKHGKHEKSGFLTSQAAMLTCGECKTNGVLPILSVGDQPANGYRFEAIPDGISFIGGGRGWHDDDDRRHGEKNAEILINHELSLVPFPGTRQDPSNSIVGRISLNGKAEVMKSSVAIPSSAGYQRFCSNFVVDKEHGFHRQLLFTNEEARDIVLRQEDSWHGPPPGVSLSEPGAEQAGVVVAYDVKSGAYKTIYGMGRHNHENSVAVPGYGKPVILSGDDTFDAPASQLYMYTAKSGKHVWQDKGKLYAFVSDNPAINDYGDVSVGMTVTGRFIEVPREIATGKDADDGSEVTSADFGYPTPAAAVPPTAAMPDGPQWVLEHWSNINNVFQFIRIEDTAYDRKNPRIMYMADTGEPRAVPHANGRLQRGGSTTVGNYMNGRLWKIELGKKNPLLGAKLSILPNANFDLNGYANANSPHQPDNIETTKHAIWFQEDTGGHNSSAPAAHFPPFPNATNARIWRYDLKTGDLKVIAEVNQNVPGAPTTLPKGNWESSGIVDASDAFGRGAFLVDVQAHGWDVPTNTHPGQNRQREQGQLLLIKVKNP